MPKFNPPFWVGDREFSAQDLAVMQTMAYRCRRLSRAEIAATICEVLSWKAPNGHLKVEACRELLGKLEVAGLVELPPLRSVTRPTNRDTQAEPLPPLELEAHLASLRPVTLDEVSPDERRVWNASVAAYHPLGYRRPIGAHQRYWIRARHGDERIIVGALLFGAAAKAVEARDQWIGWTAHERSRYRWRIVNNNRFLILPGVHVPHLASHVLGQVLHRLPQDWLHRYGFAPVLLETFVEAPWAGTCYRAANWQPVGLTAGRGRQDRHKTARLPKKVIWMYPLHRQWRRLLLAPAPEPVSYDQDNEEDVWS